MRNLTKTSTSNRKIPGWPSGQPVFLAWLAAIFVVAVWAETFVSSKILIDSGLDPADIYFYRFLLAYLFIWAISPGKLFADSRRDEFLMAILGIVGGSLYFLAENNALRYSTASNVSILVGSAPLVTTILVALFDRDERMSPVQTAGSAVAFLGMILVIFNGKFNLKLNPAGDALALGAALSWGIYSILIRKLSGRYDVKFITRKVFFYGLVSILPLFLFVKPLNTDMTLLARPVIWGNLAYLGIVASLICFVLWNWALSKLGTVRTTNLIYGQCFFTMLIAHIVLEEEITWMAILGTVILMGGMFFAVKE